MEKRVNELMKIYRGDEIWSRTVINVYLCTHTSERCIFRIPNLIFASLMEMKSSKNVVCIEKKKKNLIFYYLFYVTRKTYIFLLE